MKSQVFFFLPGKYFSAKNAALCRVSKTLIFHKLFAAKQLNQKRHPQS